MSGMSNVQFWLQSHDLPVDENVCRVILEAAKKGNRVLTEREIRDLVARAGTSPASSQG